MKLHRTLSVILLLAFVAGTFAPSIPAQAQGQSLFEGMIAYVDSSGNIVIKKGNGEQSQITTDANLGDIEEQRIEYDSLSFSPNGAYLAFYRDGISDEESGIFVYDISAGSVVKRFSFDEVGQPVQWHKDSDSFIDSDFQDTPDGSNTLWKYYRQYLSGERVFMFEYYENDNGYTISFDFNTVFYTPDPESGTPKGRLYNWVDNTNFDIDLDDWSVGGFWTHDGLRYVCTGTDREISIIDLKSGNIAKTIDLYDLFPRSEHTFPDGQIQYLSVMSNDLSPDSKHLLLSNDLSLYDLDLDTLGVETVYTSQRSSPDFRLYGSWSRSGNVIAVEEYSIGENVDSRFDGLHLFALKKGDAPVAVMEKGEFLFWLSRNSERFLYKQYTRNGQQISVELMLYDYLSQGKVKIGDLPTIPDVDRVWDTPTDFIVDWTDGETALPSAQETVPLVTVSPSVSRMLTAISDLKAVLNNPPVSIGSLTPNLNNVRLTWSFPVLNVDNVQYDLRYAEFPLNETNWESATRVNNLPSPMKFGQTQEAYTQVPENKRIYFGIKIFDQSGNFSPISNIPSFFDTSFRPVNNGYRFCNKSDAEHEQDCNREWLKYPAQVTDDIVIQLFGKQACLFKIGEKCVWDPIVSYWMDVNLAFFNLSQTGFCYGMSTSSLLISTGIGPENWDDPGDFQPGTKTVSEIGEPNGNRPVVYYQVTQNLYPVRSAFLTHEPSARDFIEKLYGLLAQKDYPILALSSEGGTGHAIIPYAVEDHSDGSYSVWVYDPNWPELYDEHPENRLLIVDVQNNTWKYELWEGEIWSNSDHYVTLLPSSLYRRQLSIDPLADVINIFPLLKTNILIENPAGQSAGYADDGFVNQIPNARVIPYYDFDVIKRDPSYELPLDTYSYSLRGDQGELGGIAQFGQNYSVVFDNIVLDPDAQEEIVVTPDGKQITYKGANPQKLNLSTAFRESQQTLGINLTGLAVEPQQPLSITTDIDKHLIVLSNISSGGVYSLTVERFTSTTYDKFVDISLPIAQNDSQIIEYGTEGNVKILIDHLSDGSIDEQRVLQKVETQTKSPFSFIHASPYLLAGGLGVLCLGVLAIGGVFFVARSRGSRRSSRKPARTPQPEGPSSSAQEIKQAIGLAKSKRNQEAFEILRRIVQAEPNNASAWFNLGGVLADMGNYRDSERCYSRARQLGHPKAAEALNWLKQKKK